MRLLELDPKWINHKGRSGVGIRFNDPKYSGVVRVLFSNPIDGGPALPDDEEIPSNNGGARWTRTGTNFDVLTIHPSINGEPGLSHFTVTDGKINL